MRDEVYFYFCANPACSLHVRAGDPNVRGTGNWATLPDGTVVGRTRLDEFMVCDQCANSIVRGELIIPAPL